MSFRSPAERHLDVHPTFRPMSRRILFVAASVLLVTAGHYLTGLHQQHTHDLFRRLYYLPIIFAGFWFGLRGGLLAAAAVAAAFLPHVLFQWRETPLANPDQYLEIALYLVVGGVTGALSQMEAQRRVELRRANQQVERAYLQLQEQSMALVKADEELRLADRLSALGELSASMAHEIRNPLGSIKGAAEIVRDGLGSDHKLGELARIVVKEADRLDEILARFLELARPKEADSGRANVRAVVDDLVRLVSGQARRSRVQISTEIDDALPPVHISPAALGQVLLNLMLNALQAMPDGGRVSLSAGVAPARRPWHAEGSGDPLSARITVNDTGPGVPAEVRGRVFDPFFTTKRSGTGLGLAICERIVHTVRGSIEVEPVPDTGARFVIELPLAPAESEGS